MVNVIFGADYRKLCIFTVEASISELESGRHGEKRQSNVDGVDKLSWKG
jgi:hypothetical protein